MEHVPLLSTPCFSLGSLWYRLDGQEPEAGFTILMPSFPGCKRFGANLFEAQATAKEAIKLHLESLLEHNEPITNENETF